MANIAIYPGSSSFASGSSTPFGFYDSDTVYQADADRVTKFCAQRLGYPIVDIELQDKNFYTAFEEAVTTYGNTVYAYKVRQDYLDLEGAQTGSNLNHALITPHMGNIVRISEQYGTEAGTGGNTDWHTGSVSISKSLQDYDLNAWAIGQGIADKDLEIKRVFYENRPPITKYFDPYAGSGMGTMNFMDQFGWGNYSPAINFMLMPLSFDLQKLQAIELNDTIRKSNFSFEIHNNNLRIFPVPTQSGSLHIQYVVKSERFTDNLNTSSVDLVSNVSNVPYANPNYTQINSIGRSWIFEYTLALCKEMLGYIRGKYSKIPIPEDSVTLNQGDLISSATKDKEALIKKLEDYLESTSRDVLMEKRSKVADYKNKELAQAPYVIYLG